MQPLLLLSCCGALTPPSFSELLWAGAAARPLGSSSAAGQQPGRWAAARPLGSSPAAGPHCRRCNLQ